MAMTKEDKGKLYRETYEKVTSSGEQWRRFLDTASNVYRYDFAKQIMIYAQRPDAEACASFSVWSDRMGRRVKYGSKGIAVYDDLTGRNEYLFDISDTIQTADSRPVYHWSLDDVHREAVINRLSTVLHMNADDSLSFEDNVLHFIGRHVEDQWRELEEDYERELRRQERTEEEAEAEKSRQKKLMYATVGYMVLKRCGVQGREIAGKFDFEDISEIDKDQTAAIGEASARMADQILQEIKNAVREYDRENFEDEYKALKNYIEESREELLSHGTKIAVGTVKHHREEWAAISISSMEKTHDYGLILKEDGSFLVRLNAPHGLNYMDNERIYDKNAVLAENAVLIPFEEAPAEVKYDVLLHAKQYKENIHALKEELAGRRKEHEQNAVQDGHKGDDAAGYGGTDGERRDNQIWDDEVRISAGQQENTAGEPEAGNDAARTSFGHPETGGGDEGRADTEDEEKGRRNGRNEEQPPDALDSEDGKHHTESRGSSAAASNPKLNPDKLYIYQIDDDKENARNFLFESYERLMMKDSGAVSLDNYRLVYEEENPQDINLNHIFERFNFSHPDGFTGHSLSVSDVVVREIKGTVLCDFCDTVGWRRVPDFLKSQELEEPYVPQAQYYVSPADSDTYELKVTYVNGNEEIDYDEFSELTEVTAGYTLYKGSHDACLGYLDKLNSGEITEAEIPKDELSVHNAFQRLKENHDFLPEAIKFLDRVERYIIRHGEIFSSQIFNHPAFQNAYGNVSKVSEKLFGGELKAVEDELKGYLSAASETEEMSDNTQKADYASNEKSFAEQVDDVLRRTANDYDDLKVCDTPQILLDIGCEQLPMLYTRKHLNKAIAPENRRKHTHGLTLKQIKKIPELLKKPVMIYDSLTRSDSIVVVTSEIVVSSEEDANNRRPLIVSIRPNGNGTYNLEKLDSNFITSIYGREEFSEHFQDVLNQGKLLFIDKAKSQELFRVLRLEFPQGVNNLDFDIIIRQSQNIINTKPQNSSNNFLQPPQNFVIAEDAGLGAGTPKEKFRKNVEAIHTLKKIEEESRAATLEEQKILSQYVGWGGLSDAFDEGKTAWAEEYQELKELLSEEEYRNARASTTDAFYTAPEIAACMYEALQNMGFSGGNILEPSMGIGNFFGSLPPAMERQSRLYGVEQDSISGRIATFLYPKADITVSGFEKTDFSNDFFDVVIGNVPFGETGVYDKDYKNQNFLIHDYFIAKSIDKVRVGGMVAVITSKGSMDKASENVRKYINERAEFVGAVRLPNTAFKANAGTEVTSDILFFQKREAPSYEDAEWLHTVTRPDGMVINRYFDSHPEMVLGTMAMVSGRFGMTSTCIPNDDKPFIDQLKTALSHMNARIEPPELMADYDDEKETALPGTKTIPADPDVRNFSYTVKGDVVYFRENSVMRTLNNKEAKGSDRIKGLVELRDITAGLLDMQLDESVTEDMLAAKRAELNLAYDLFVEKHGMINSRVNRTAFQNDSSYHLLCSLEKLDEDGNFKAKADIFTRRTISIRREVTHVESCVDALAVSLADVGKVDIERMMGLTGKSENEVINDLYGVIFKNPLTGQWETSEEYLSGNIREKLAAAKLAAKTDAIFQLNEEALLKSLPEDLTAEQIDARLGSVWIDPEYIKDFMVDILGVSRKSFDDGIMDVTFSEYGAAWSIKGKQFTWGNVKVREIFGVKDVMDAFQLLELSLNLKEAKVYRTVEENGKEKRVLDHDKTVLVGQKQSELKEAFKEWLWKDFDRREALVRKYNDLFNATVPRHYDGSHLKFDGSNPGISLLQHQRNAVARILYGGNTLLAHCVGAGKTFTMIASAMEKKRLGLCHKSLITVPNHLTSQWGADFLKLYPNAKVLVATKKDFEPANRKKFCSRIATGEYDAVIIGHSQFEKIPLSVEKQKQMVQEQMDEVTAAIARVKAESGDKLSIKQLEKTRKSMEKNLAELNDAPKDDVVTFEQLGVDSLYVDESHMFKNLYIYTKMTNMAGVQTTESKKATDMYNKCMYLDEVTGGRGITFATGTPIANTMAELYTNMRYLQSDMLKKTKLSYFDAWASTFGETVTALEMKPEGNGFRMKTRFAKFFNLPELMNLWKEAADIQTKEMLPDLLAKLPQAEQHNIVLSPSEEQKAMVEALAKRAEAVRNRQVSPEVDNMLKITNDGRKLALDQRLINSLLPDEEGSKVNACVKQVVQIWQETASAKSTQAIFCDLSTPKEGEAGEQFSVYDDIRKKLIENGIPAEEIAFIHDAGTEAKKAELFGKVNQGKVRIILGSTEKMGAGTNIQHKLVALHHLDVPWRPADLEQQEGRIIRQGNENEKVHIYRYIKEDTFDGYSWQTIENKNRFITQVMTDKSPARRADDVDEAVLDTATLKGLCISDKRIKEKMDLDIEVQRLELLKNSYTMQLHQFEKDIQVTLPEAISGTKKQIEGFLKDKAVFEANKNALGEDGFRITVNGKVYTDKKAGAEAFLKAFKESLKIGADKNIGEYLGFNITSGFVPETQTAYVLLSGNCKYRVEMGQDAGGCIIRMNNRLSALSNDIDRSQEMLERYEHSLASAKEEVSKPFAKEEELKLKKARLIELNAQLNHGRDDRISFYVAENILCSKGSDMEEVKGDIPTLAEAKEIYDRMPPSETKGIGFVFQDTRYVIGNQTFLDAESIFQNAELKEVSGIKKAVAQAVRLFPEAKLTASEETRKQLAELNAAAQHKKDLG